MPQGGSSGDTAPTKTLSGASTGLDSPRGVSLDSVGNMYVPNIGNESVTVYAAGWTSGDTAPIKTLIGAATGLLDPTSVAFDSAENMFVTNAGNNSVTAYGDTGGPVVPGAPTISSVTAGNAKLTVAFTAGSNGGSTITNYQYSTNNGSSWSAASPAVTRSPLTISGLKNGTTYRVKIRAVNSVGSGAASNMKQGVPVAPQPAKAAQQLPAGAIPAKVKFRGVTVLNKQGAKTRQGRSVTARTQVKLSGSSSKRCFRLVKGKSRKLSIHTSGKCSFKLTATYTAPGNSKYRPLKVTKTYRIKR